jgi:hypothetical protein
MMDHISVKKPERFEELEPAHKADWLRFALLAEHGGFWLDASLILTRNLDHIIQEIKDNESEGYAFKHYEADHLENWFLASIPKAEFMVTWFNDFDKMTYAFGSDGEAYLAFLSEQYGPEVYYELVKGNTDPVYLRSYVAAEKIKRIDKIKMFHLGRCDTKPHGPFYEFLRVKWNQKEVVDIIVRNPVKEPLSMYKLPSNERNSVTDALKNHSPHPESVFQKYVLDKLPK